MPPYSALSRARRQRGGAALVVIVVLAALAAGAWWWWRGRAADSAGGLQFNTTQVARGDVIQKITATGDLQPVIEVEVSSQISGLLTEVLVDFNDRVKEGDVLARIDPATYESRLASARAEYANTEANHRLVQLNHERIKSLFERKLVSQQELDQAQAQLAQAEAQLLTRRASVANAETDLARCTLYAPIDGIVIDRLAEVGKTVAASLNAPTLFTLINDLREMEINAYVSEADIGVVAEGQRVEFTVDAYPDRTFRGLVRQIRNAPLKDQSVIVYSTIIKVDNSDLRLKPGMTANVSIVVAARENVLRVPNSALRVRPPDSVEIIARAEPDTPPGSAPTAPTASAAADPREQWQALMREAGWSGEGRPDREVFIKARQLAQERGIELPQRGSGGGGWGGGGGGGNGGSERPARQIATDNRPTVRTLYRLLAGAPMPRLESFQVTLGITDGSTTEVLAGLAEGDEIVSGLALTAAGANDNNGANNPFSGRPNFRR